MNFRETTRVGPCFHCGSATVQACMACENFVCSSCERTHAVYQDHERIVRSKPAG